MAIVLNNSLYWQARIDYNTLRNDIAQVHNLLNNMNSRVQTQGSAFDNMFSRLGAGMAAFFSVQQAAQFVNQLIEVRGQFQMLDVAFSTILKSKEKADVLMKEMVDLALKTPFELKDVAGGAKQLLAYGFAAERIVETITMLGNIASGVGAPLNDIIYLYGTLQTQGRAYTRDILQFTSRGIPIIAELARQFGVTNKEVQKLVEDGKVGFEQVEKAFQNMTRTGGMFENLMEKQAKTLPGMISNMKDAWTQLLNELGKSNEGFFAGVITGLTNTINELKALIKNTDSSDVFSTKSSIFEKSMKGMPQNKADEYIAFNLNAAIKQYEFLNKEFNKFHFKDLWGGKKEIEEEIKGVRKYIDYLKELQGNGEKVKSILTSGVVPEEKEIVTGFTNTLKGLREEMKALDDQIENMSFSGDWEKKLAEIVAQKKDLQLIIDEILNPTGRYTDFSFLDVPNQIKGKKSTGVSQGEITPLNKDNYAKEVNVTKDYTRQMQLAFKDLFDDIDGLGRKSLLKRLDNLKTELVLFKGTGEEKIRIEQKVSDVTEALQDKTVNNLEMVADALIEIGNLAGGAVGEQFAKLGNSLGSAVQGFASGNYVQGVAGALGFAQQFGDLLSGATKEAREQEQYYESQAKWLEYMTRELQKQVNLTNDLQGVEIYSGFESAISNTEKDIADIENKIKSSAKLLTGFKFDNGFLGIGAKYKPIFADISKLAIEDLKELVEQANKNDGRTNMGFIKPEDLDLLNDYIDQYDAAQKQAIELRNKYNETITGTTYEGLLGSIKDAFSDGELSAQEMADFTEDAMKTAMMKSFEIEFLQKQMQNWYDAFAEANKDGQITTDERAKLVKDFQDEMLKANEGLKIMSETLGLDLSSTDDSKSTMAGSIKGLTEETGGKIEGAFNGVRLTNLQLLGVAQKNLEKLTLIEENTYTLFEIRDLIKRGNSNQLVTDRAYGI